MMRIFWCRGLPPTMALVLGWIALLSVGSATSTAAPCGAAGGMAGRVGRSACTMGLRGGRELEQETRRKPFDENVEAADVILKDYKKKGAHAPSALEFLLGDTLLKLADADSTRMLKYLHIMSARDVTVPGTGERAIVIFVPYIEMKEYRKMCPGVTEALEDQLKAHVFLVAHRRIIRKERRGKALYKQKRPQSRTMAKVHEAYMEDLIWPHDVVGQKTVYSVGVKKPTDHIYLDPATRATTEAKMPVIVAVYQNLTGKKVVLDYLIYHRSSELVMQRTPNRYPCDPAGFLSYSEVKPASLFEGSPPSIPEGERTETHEDRMLDAAH